MLKECVILNGQIINIGEWDYQIQSFEVEPPQYNEEGEVIKKGVFEDRPTNPMPEGATVEQREVTQNADGGWVAASDYVSLRKAEYPSLADQLDAMWKGEPYYSQMQAAVLAIKEKYPKN